MMPEKSVDSNRIFISVIVTAHDRREFIMKALASIMRQTLSRDRYEVIVVKNYKDDEVDRYIEFNNYKSIVTNAVRVGKKLSMAINISKGNVITILEDDDEYNESRLQAVYETFMNIGETVYFENMQAYIDQNGNTISRFNRLKNEEDIRIENNGITTEEYLQMLKEPAGNVSCMAISKKILVDHLEDLSKIMRSPDTFILFLGFSHSNFVVRDRRKLTKQRIHVSATKLPDNLTRNVYLREKYYRGKSSYDDWNVIINLTIGTNVYRIATLLLNHRKFLYLMYSQDRKAVIDSLKYIVKLTGFVGIKTETLNLLAWAMHLFSPSFFITVAYLHYRLSLN